MLYNFPQNNATETLWKTVKCYEKNIL